MRLRIEANADTNDDLVTNVAERYICNKSELDKLTKKVKEDGEVLKELILGSGSDTLICGQKTIKRLTLDKSSLNEEKLLEVLKRADSDMQSKLIKTKEYVDIEALEKMMYDNSLPIDIVKQIGECKEAKEVVQLRITNTKKGDK